MKSIAIRVMLASVALGAALFALAGTANAVRVLAEISVPGEIPVGQPVEVQATLRSADEGLAVADIPVTFYAEASFGGVSGEVELGQAVTDENGVATLNFQPRSAGDHQVRIEYLPPGETEPAAASTAISVTGSTSQLHRSTAGVDIPGLNVWLLIALVSGVWAILLSVALRVVAIARAGDDIEMAESAARPGHAEDQQAASQSGASGAQ